MTQHSEVQHIQVEDGRGKPLGRSFAVKLWPTFVFLHDGDVIARAVRPEAAELELCFHMLAQTNPKR